MQLQCSKINQKNTWQLKLIDHLSEIIKVEAQNDAETNFQKASCTLEAGMKIYSVRVDAVHSEAYKIFSRVNYTGLEDEKGCCVLFDSCEVPGKYKSCPNEIDASDKIDLSFTQEPIEQMEMTMASMTDISPTLKNIVRLLDEHSENSMPTVNLTQESDLECDAYGNNEPDMVNNIYGNYDYDVSSFDHCDETGIVNVESSSADPAFQRYHEDDDNYTFYKPNMDDCIEKIPKFLFQGLVKTLKQNAWAGPDHWKYWGSKCSEGDHGLKCGPNFTIKRPRRKTILGIDVEFVKFLDKELPDIFSLPQNPKVILLPAN